MEEPTILYMCLTCGTWKTLNFLEAALAQSATMKPVCATCNQIMYNALTTDKLELMEELEPYPVEQLHPFYARIFLSDEACADNPMLAHVRMLITGPWAQSLDEVIYFRMEHVRLPDADTVFTVRFKDGDENKITFDSADFRL